MLRSRCFTVHVPDSSVECSDVVATVVIRDLEREAADAPQSFPCGAALSSGKAVASCIDISHMPSAAPLRCVGGMICVHRFDTSSWQSLLRLPWRGDPPEGAREGGGMGWMHHLGSCLPFLPWLWGAAWKGFLHDLQTSCLQCGLAACMQYPQPRSGPADLFSNLPHERAD